MIVVTGPESSGTSLVSRILRTAGAEVAHRSATFTDDWPDLVALASQSRAVVIVYRDPVATMRSQIAAGLSPDAAWLKLQKGYRAIAAIFQIRTPVWCVTYEQLILDPDSIRPLLDTLGLNDQIEIEPVTNENAKHRSQSDGMGATLTAR